MAGRGPAPKKPSQRRNRTEPARGEWVTLPDDPVPDAPSLPRPTPKGGWNVQAKREWRLWWDSPMVHMWDDTDHATLEVLLRMIHEFWEKPNASLSGHIRLYKDSLGLTPKGRQDRRWQLPSNEEAEVTPLRAVSGDRPVAVDPG